MGLFRRVINKRRNRGTNATLDRLAGHNDVTKGNKRADKIQVVRGSVVTNLRRVSYRQNTRVTRASRTGNHSSLYCVRS